MSQQAAEEMQDVIVVGVDMAETGEFALLEGMRLARSRPGSSLHVVHVLDAPERLNDAGKIDELSEQLQSTRQKLQDHVRHVCRPQPPAEPFDHEVTLHVRLGKPAHAILQVSVDVEADLLVVGTHARTGVQRWVMGSVAEELLRTARCPLVVAHPKHYEGLAKTDQVDPPRPGQDLQGTGTSESVSLHFSRSPSHIAGLI